MDFMFALRMLMNRSREGQKQLYCVFLGLERKPEEVDTCAGIKRNENQA